MSTIRELYRGGPGRADHINDLVREISYQRAGDWVIRTARPDDTASPDLYIQVGHWRKDVVTGLMGWGYGGKYRVSEHATDSEIVQAVFGLFKAYEEHEVRENFEWRGARIFGPHIDVLALHAIAEHTDARQPLLEPTDAQIMQAFGDAG